MARSNPLSGPSRFLPLIAFVLSIAALYFAREVLIPFALAVLFSFLLTPVVKVLERCRLGRVTSVGVVVLVSLLVAGAIGWVVSNQLIDVISQLPGYRENIHKKVAALQGPAGGALKKAADNVRELSEELTLQPGAGGPPAPPSRPVPVEVVEHPPSALQYLGNMLAPVVVPLGTAFIVVVFTIFILMKREDVRNRLIRLVAPRQLNTMTQVLDDAALGVSRYLLVQFSLNTVYGCLIATGLYYIGVPNYLLWGVLAGLLRFIPYIGPLIGGALPLLLALGVFDSWTPPLMILGFFTAVELIASQVVEPVIGGARTGISPLAILVAAVFWGALWGPAGLILSMPLTVCVVVLGRHVPQLEFLNVLLGDEPVLSPEARLYQRLLALDQQEAQTVVDGFLKEGTAIQLYDQVIIPALSLAEQDRHKGALDEAKEAFIVQSISELIGELAEYRLSEALRSGGRSMRVICLPANDQADEISAAMLAQLLEQAGYPVVCLPLADSVPDAVEEMAGIVPHPGDVVCISSLPPFAVLNARTMNKRLRARFPDLKIIVGLWTFSPSEGAAERLGQAFGGTVVTTLAEALNQIEQLDVSTSQEPSAKVADKVVREAPVARG